MTSAGVVGRGTLTHPAAELHWPASVCPAGTGRCGWPGQVETPAIVRRRRGRASPSFVGVVIALLVLLPETLAAGRAARRDRIQTSLNLAFGSAMASIGLTIPAIAIASIWLHGPLLLGLDATQMVLLAVTVVVAILTVVPGRATRLQGAVHLVLLAAFLFLAVNP